MLRCCLGKQVILHVELISATNPMIPVGSISVAVCEPKPYVVVPGRN